MKLATCDDYLEGVASGEIRVGRLVELAIARHHADLELGRFRFDAERAEHAVNFFSFLRHHQGEWAGTPFELEAWQAFVIGSLFGWVDEHGHRRYRQAYVQVARKNGKTQLGAGLGLYMMFADGEPGAQCFTAATKRDQARISHQEATRMVVSSGLREHIGIFKDNLHHVPSHSKYEPLGADSNTLDGLNVHFALIDELHAHKGRGLVEVLETATGARRQPLIFMITTAGFDRHSICYEKRDYAQAVLETAANDDRFFAYVAELDEGDQWTDRASWIKGNPNLGVSVYENSLVSDFERASYSPAAFNAFRRLRLNQWTETENRYIPADQWDACKALEVDLTGRECFGGLDVASTIDLSAYVLLFPPNEDDELWHALAWFWVPEETLTDRVRRDRVEYDAWRDQGYISVTPGDTTDYRTVAEDIVATHEKYDIQTIAYDRWNTSGLITELVDNGLDCVPVPQTYATYGPAIREFGRIMLAREFNHGGNPVLRWNALNATVKEDPSGYLKPDKGQSRDKIDGLVALLMGVGQAIMSGPTGTVYTDRGLIQL